MNTTRTIPLPTLMLLAATRGMLGAGLGLLLAGRLGERRKTIGRLLLAIGLASTVPLALRIFRQPSEDEYVDISRFRYLP